MNIKANTKKKRERKIKLDSLIHMYQMRPCVKAEVALLFLVYSSTEKHYYISENICAVQCERHLFSISTSMYA